MMNEQLVAAADDGAGVAAVVNASASSSSESSGSRVTSASGSDDADSGKNVTTNVYDDDDDEDGDVCRICRNPGDVDNPLRYPCACSGSIKFVHQDCLLQWLNHSNARQCEFIGLIVVVDCLC
ncbi:putative Zinc finger, RING-CH-type, Zinc finger, RING/FYVE/PHD-type [Helianthus annuus]|nr:putative Zinc finger, RING-CH-type, Zinc finger, RING/FYVE/PHD-type [Helianthus annuus]